MTRDWIGQTAVQAIPIYGKRGVTATTNTPGARAYGVGWADATGNFWLFGGSLATSGIFNDLWRYQQSTRQWT